MTPKDLSTLLKREKIFTGFSSHRIRDLYDILKDVLSYKQYTKLIKFLDSYYIQSPINAIIGEFEILDKIRSYLKGYLKPKELEELAHTIVSCYTFFYGISRGIHFYINYNKGSIIIESKCDMEFLLSLEPDRMFSIDTTETIDGKIYKADMSFVNYVLNGSVYGLVIKTILSDGIRDAEYNEISRSLIIFKKDENNKIYISTDVNLNREIVDIHSFNRMIESTEYMDTELCDNYINVFGNKEKYGLLELQYCIKRFMELENEQYNLYGKRDITLLDNKACKNIFFFYILGFSKELNVKFAVGNMYDELIKLFRKSRKGEKHKSPKSYNRKEYYIKHEKGNYKLVRGNYIKVDNGKGNYVRIPEKIYTESKVESEELNLFNTNVISN